MTGSAFFERRDPGAVLALGFGTTVAMWAAGYLLRLPWIQAPSALVALAMLGLLACGGFLAGRFAGGWRTGALAGLLTMALNVLILGSLLTSMLIGEPSIARVLYSQIGQRCADHQRTRQDAAERRQYGRK